jgi:hypothetical protein
VKENVENPMENPNLFGGDMVGVNFFDDEDRKAIPRDDMRWPEGIIYYNIDDSLIVVTDLIDTAMKHIESKVQCVKFQKRKEEPDFVNLYLGEGCSSNVGRAGGQQNLSLGPGCHYFRTVVHEIMHVTGFYHEQNRSDRDQFIEIHWENIDVKKWSQFRKFNESENRLLTTFDFSSVMLYGPTAFNNNSGITMSSKIAGKEVVNYSQEEGLSVNDTISIKKLYGCDK